MNRLIYLLLALFLLCSCNEVQRDDYALSAENSILEKLHIKTDRYYIQAAIKFIEVEQNIMFPHLSSSYDVDDFEIVFSESDLFSGVSVYIIETYIKTYSSPSVLLLSYNDQIYAKVRFTSSIELQFGDVDGDRQNELVALYLGNGNSQMFRQNATAIYKIVDDEICTLFETEYGDHKLDTGFRCFQDGFLVDITNEYTDLAMRVEAQFPVLIEGQSQFSNKPVFDIEGKVLPDMRNEKLMSIDNGNLQAIRLVDVDGDGIQEIMSWEVAVFKHRFGGKIGYAHSILKYDAAAGNMAVVDAGFVTDEDEISDFMEYANKS